jgi:hypothetical protein
MTVNTNAPVNYHIGNGVLKTFAFTYKHLETADVYVWLDGVLQIEFSHYTYVNVTDAGGDVLFVDAPASGAEVIILRRTPITQQIDYQDQTAFPAETHETGADKLIMILQEWIDGASTPDDVTGTVDYDLSATQQATTVTVENEAGTDAVIPSWVSGVYAGAFHGEITESAPLDDAVSAKPDGYVYIEVLPTP